MNGSVNVPCVWINGRRVDLPVSDVSKSGRASGIFISRRSRADPIPGLQYGREGVCTLPFLPNAGSAI